MYDKNDKLQAILRVQLYLQTISRVNKKIPRVNPDGMYGEETKEAVKAFQREYGLAVTGVVDLGTFELLFSEYVRINKEAAQNRNFRRYVTNGTIKKGQKSDAVKVLQITLNLLATAYNGFDKIEINGEFDAPTEEAVKHFQKVNGLKENGEVDAPTFEALNEQAKIHSYSQ